jgi:hypothetical protein
MINDRKTNQEKRQQEYGVVLRHGQSWKNQNDPTLGFMKSSNWFSSSALKFPAF